MCLDHSDGTAEAASAEDVRVLSARLPGDLSAEEVARGLADLAELRRPHVGFVGYGGTSAGDRVLVAVDSHYEPRAVDAIASALRAKGAKVDVLQVDVGPDRVFEELDEIRVTIRNRPWSEEPRRWEGLPWVEELARQAGYDLLIHGKGGPTPQTDYRYEQIPWLRTEHLEQGAAVFPRDLHELINRRTWARIWQYGRDGRVRLTDPEGTDLTYTLHAGYFDGSRRGFTEDPVRSFGHLLAHPPPPMLEEEDAAGVIAGTTGHFSRPFPSLKLRLEGGQLVAVEGGGAYGKAWADLLEATRSNRYPCFPRPGLFWLWEVAIGTNPLIRRPSNIHMLSSGGFEWERRRAGVIHIGLGTRWRGPEEAWAGELGITYGHLHVHLLFSTFQVTAPDGSTTKVIENGRLCALDDPEVRELAARYGDPDEILRERWIPQVPGITVPGSYGEFAADPTPWIYPPGV